MDKDKIQRIVQSLSEESLDKMIAISMFSSKLRQLNLSDTIETQLHFLSNYREVNSGNLTKKDFCPYQEKFLEKIAAENLMSCHLENQIVDLSPLLAIIAIQRFAINTNDNKYIIKKKSVIQEYYNLLGQYESFVYAYILDNNDFSLTNNPPTAFEKYVNAYNRHEEVCNQLLNPSQLPSQIKTIFDEFIPIIIELRKEGLDNETISNFIDNVLIGKLNAVLFTLTAIPSSGIIVRGLNDVSTCTTIITQCERVLNEIELNEKQKVEVNKCLDAWKRMKSIQTADSNNSGCLGIILLIIFAFCFTQFI